MTTKLPDCPPPPPGVPAVTLEGYRLHELWQLAWHMGHAEGHEHGLAQVWELRDGAPPAPTI